MEDEKETDDDSTIGEKLLSFEIVNLAQDVGEQPPPALAWISLNGHVFETNCDILETIATEMKAARKRSRNGLGGRGGSSITTKELAGAARQRTLDWKAGPSRDPKARLLQLAKKAVEAGANPGPTAEAETGPRRRTR